MDSLGTAMPRLGGRAGSWLESHFFGRQNEYPEMPIARRSCCSSLSAARISSVLTNEKSCSHACCQMRVLCNAPGTRASPWKTVCRHPRSWKAFSWPECASNFCGASECLLESSCNMAAQAQILHFAEGAEVANLDHYACICQSPYPQPI